MTLIKKKLAGHRNELKSHGIKSLAVFGSVARGGERPDRDVDLLVEFESTVGMFHFIHVQDFIGGLLAGARADLVTREAIYEELKEDIYSEAARLLPDNITSRHHQIPRDDMRAMRNVVTHEYD